jgi:hypothetical protein
MNKRKRWSRLAVTAVAALGVAGGTAFAAAGNGGAPPTRTTVSQAQSVSSAQLHGYGALRHAAGAGMPAAARQIPADAMNSYGPNPALAGVTYPSGDPSDAVYVIPGTDSLCFYAVKTQQGACSSLANAAAGKFVVWSMPMRSGGVDANAHATKVVGIVPDDVTAATVATGSGSAPAHLHGNVVEASGKGIRSLKLKTASGATLSVAGP